MFKKITKKITAVAMTMVLLLSFQLTVLAADQIRDITAMELKTLAEEAIAEVGIISEWLYRDGTDAYYRLPFTTAVKTLKDTYVYTKDVYSYDGWSAGGRATFFTTYNNCYVEAHLWNDCSMYGEVTHDAYYTKRYNIPVYY